MKRREWLSLKNRALLFFVSFLFPWTAFAAPRIVSLLPSNTEIVESLGAGASIVGVTVYDRPLSPGRAVVGDFVNPSIEKIVSLKPDLILAGAWENSRVVPELRRLKIPVLEVHNPASLDELYASIRQVADSIGASAKAPGVIDTMQKELSGFAAAAPRPPLTLYIEIDTPFWTIGGHDFLSETLCRIGACNIFSDVTHPSSQVSSEAVIERNPDLIISLDADKKEIARRPGWDHIRAVQKGWIIDRSDINPDRLSRPSPRLIEGLRQIAARIAAFRSVP